MKKIALITLLLLTSCASIKKDARIRDDINIAGKVDEAEKICQAKYDNGEIKTHELQVECERNIANKIFDEDNYELRDIYRIYFNSKFYNAQNFDNGKITEKVYIARNKYFEQDTAQDLKKAVDAREKEIAAENVQRSNNAALLMLGVSNYGYNMQNAAQNSMQYNQEHQTNFLNNNTYCTSTPSGGSIVTNCNRY